MNKLMKRNNKKGFTLVELIVVIVIIAILAAALVTSLVGYINKAKDTTALVEGNNVYTAAQAYVSEKSIVTNITAESKPTLATLKSEVAKYLGVDAAKVDITTCTIDANASITNLVCKTTNNKTVTFNQANLGSEAGAWSVE